MHEEKPLISISQLVGLIGTMIGVWSIMDQKGWRSQDSISTCLLIFIAVGTVWMSFNYHRLKYRRYRIIHTDRGKEGIEALEMIRKAKSNITVMHSYGNVPSQEYTDVVISAVKHRRVPLVRIIPDYVYDFPEVKQWLSQFDDLEHYRPYVVPGNHSMVPFHFILIDDCEGLLYFPDRGRATDATEVMIFRDRELANLMRNVVIRLITEQPRQTRRKKGITTARIV
jgi:hypothetical protein